MEEKKKLDKKVWVPILIGIIAVYYTNDFICAVAPRNGHMWGFEDFAERWDFTKLRSPFNVVSPVMCVVVFILTYKGVKAGMGSASKDKF